MFFNPFALKGPEFLLFYTILFVVLVGLYYFLCRNIEPPTTTTHDELDAYEIAYLQGGEMHAINVATISLITRGLLIIDGIILKTASKSINSALLTSVRKGLEKAILITFRRENTTNDTTNELYKNTDIKKEVSHIAEKLQRLNLIPNEQIKKFQERLLLLFVAILTLTAIYKIYIAIKLNRPFLFLLILGILYPIFLFRMHDIFKITAAGKKLLKKYQETYSNLLKRKDSIPINGSTNELSLLAAVFGLAVLPSSLGYITAALKFPHPSEGFSMSMWSGSCGSSGCGSGCGGGCGGCG